MAMNNRQKAIENKDLRAEKLELKIQAMSDKEVAEELKKKGIGTFGTKAEREQRLRKVLGLGRHSITQAKHHHQVRLEVGLHRPIQN